VPVTFVLHFSHVKSSFVRWNFLDILFLDVEKGMRTACAHPSRWFVHPVASSSVSAETSATAALIFSIAGLVYVSERP